MWGSKVWKREGGEVEEVRVYPDMITKDDLSYFKHFRIWTVVLHRGDTVDLPF